MSKLSIFRRFTSKRCGAQFLSDNKTQCIRYGKYAYTRDTHSGVMLEGKLLNWHSSITYLGSVLRYDLSDDADIRQKVGIFVSQVNNLNKRFGQLSMRVKSKLMQSYCCSWFGCQTWDINCKYAKKMNISWNKAVRRVLGIPYRTHTALLPYLIENPSFRKQHISRYIKFYNSLLMSDNDSVKYIAECAYVNVTSVLGINIVHCQSDPLTEPLVGLLWPTLTIDHCCENLEVYMNRWNVRIGQLK